MLTPAYKQALYIQQQQEIELAARSASHLSVQAAQQSAADLLAYAQAQQLQVRCTVVQALLQLSPLLSEESIPQQAVVDAMLFELMPDSTNVMRRRQDVWDDDEPDLRQLCMLELASLTAQPQSCVSLLALPSNTDLEADVPLSAAQKPPVREHIMIRRCWEVMEKNAGFQLVNLHAAELAAPYKASKLQTGSKNL